MPSYSTTRPIHRLGLPDHPVHSVAPGTKSPAPNVRAFIANQFGAELSHWARTSMETRRSGCRQAMTALLPPSGHWVVESRDPTPVA